jgi:hypothetical protein
LLVIPPLASSCAKSIVFSIRWKVLIPEIREHE